MRAPSAKTLTSTFRLSSEATKLIRKFAAAADNGERLKGLVDAWAPATVSYVRSMHSDPYRSQLWRNTVALHAINEHLGTYGVEGLGPARSGDYVPPFKYLNAGDPYSATLIYDRDKDRLFVGSWGDVSEKHPEWEGSDSHATMQRSRVKTGMPNAPKKSPARLDREIAEVLGAKPINKRKTVRHFSEAQDKLGRTCFAVTYEDHSGHTITPEELQSYREREARGDVADIGRSGTQKRVHAIKKRVLEKGQRVAVLDYRGHEIGRGHVYSSDNYPAPNEYTTWVKMTRHGETTTEE